MKKHYDFSKSAKNPYDPKSATTLKKFRARALTDPGVRKAFDALESEFALLDAKCKARASSTRIKYKNERLGKLKIMEDFLPPPEELAFREEGVKTTIVLSKRSVEFFKDQAEKNNTQYQRMIRQLLDAYASLHERPLTSRSTRRAKARR